MGACCELSNQSTLSSQNPSLHRKPVDISIEHEINVKEDLVVECIKNQTPDKVKEN